MKYILSVILLSMLVTPGRSQKKNWQNLDLRRDSMFGISAEKAYQEILSDKIPRIVIVAVVDNGIDTSHEDLLSSIWTNTNEIPGNGIDDDHNGYIDDVHGWNFLGSELGVEDVTNLARERRGFFDSLSYIHVPQEYQYAYQNWRKMSNAYNEHLENAQSMRAQALSTKTLLENIVAKLARDSPTVENFKRYQPVDNEEAKLCAVVIKQLPKYSNFYQYKSHEIDEVISSMKYHNDHGLNSDYDSNGDSFNSLGRCYGDNDVSGGFTLLTPAAGPHHGTHIAGIIAAGRDNDIGAIGIANKVLIMPIRVMSFYRELRDYDLANAIRYAVDNGARIINLSFGKPYSYRKKEVDEAVKYAMKKDVLIIHAAGNDGEDIDEKITYPNPFYLDGSGRSEAWIEVGASRPYDDSVLVAAFSNYGKKKVDVFAPGTGIYSTIPGSKYETSNGTSMAAPVVAGVAALLREYYPRLSAVQIKDIILNSVVKVNHKVYIKNRDGMLVSVPFSEICSSGGIVNAYNALRLAAQYK